MFSRRTFAAVAPSGRIVMLGARAGLKMLEQALAIWPILESTWEGGLPTDIDPEFCKLYGYSPGNDAQYHRKQCSSLEQPDTHSNSLQEWVRSHPKWFAPDENLACYTGYDD